VSWGNIGAKIGITGLGLALIALHILYPALKVDVVTVTLFAIAILPWLYSYIESAKLPGGVEIKFRDIREAGEKISRVPRPELAAEEAKTKGSDAATTPQLEDPNLALVDLRIKIEQSLRVLANKHGVEEHNQGVQRLLTELTRRGIVEKDKASSLILLIRAGNEAAHGAKVDPAIARWAGEWGPAIVEAVRGL